MCGRRVSRGREATCTRVLSCLLLPGGLLQKEFKENNSKKKFRGLQLKGKGLARTGVQVTWSTGRGSIRLVRDHVFIGATSLSPIIQLA